MNVLRQLVRTKPTVVAGFIRYALGALVAFGLIEVTPDAIDFYSGQGLALWLAIQSIIEILSTTWTWGQVAPKDTYEPLAKEVAADPEAPVPVKQRAYRALPKSGVKEPLGSAPAAKERAQKPVAVPAPPAPESAGQV